MRLKTLCALPVLLLPALSVATAAPSSQRQAELLHLLRHDCGSCHGMTLQGGLGPALLPERLAAYPADFLQATIAQGRPGTPMPPWEGILAPGEIAWLVERLQRGVSP